MEPDADCVDIGMDTLAGARHGCYTAIERIVRTLGLIAVPGSLALAMALSVSECSASTLTFYLFGSPTHLALSLSAQEWYQWVLLVSSRRLRYNN